MVKPLLSPASSCGLRSRGMMFPAAQWYVSVSSAEHLRPSRILEVGAGRHDNLETVPYGFS